jgi:uncharacterized LabA/DUF88 family protein
MEKVGQQKVGVYVDVSNIAQNGGYGMHYDVLREFACRNQGIAMRLNAYVAHDEEKAKSDHDYKEKSDNFHAILRDFGFKVIVKKVKWYYDENNTRFGKANADLDMAVDSLLQSDRLDYVLLATGDGDFLQVVKALQNKGCRVEVLAFNNVSSDLKKEADVFTSGYLVPDLLTSDNDITKPWGTEGSRVRGICYNWFSDKGYGFMRYLKNINGGLWVTDTRKLDSPYETAFVHESQMSEIIDIHTLPNRDYIFEFTVIKRNDKGYQAIDIKKIHRY